MIRRFLRSPWTSFAVCSSMLLLLLLPRLVRSFDHPKYPSRVFGDYGTYWASGDAARHGLNPYATYPLTWTFPAFNVAGPVITDLNLNPPAVLPLFSFLSRLDPKDGVKLYLLISVALFLVTTAFLIWRQHAFTYQVWWLLTGGAFVGTLAVRQNYVLLFALSVIAWLSLEAESDIVAGIFLGLLCAIKPNFLVWPLFLGLTGRRKVLPSACAIFILLATVPVFLYGPGIYAEWLRACRPDIQHTIFPTEVSIIANATRFRAQPVGYLISTLTLGGSALFVYATRPSLRNVSGIAICAAILCSPVSWSYYILALAPILLSHRWTWIQQIAAWTLWINPVFLDPKDLSKPALAERGLVYSFAFVALLFSYAQPVWSESLAGARERLQLAIESRDSPSNEVAP